MKYIAYIYLVIMWILILLSVKSIVDTFTMVCIVVAGVVSMAWVYKEGIMK